MKKIFSKNILSYVIFINLDTNLFYIFFHSYFEEIKELSWTSKICHKKIIVIIKSCQIIYIIITFRPFCLFWSRTIWSLCSKINADLRILTCWLNANKFPWILAKQSLFCFDLGPNLLLSPPFLSFLVREYIQVQVSSTSVFVSINISIGSHIYLKLPWSCKGLTVLYLSSDITFPFKL